jgi:hypothetical protein
MEEEDKDKERRYIELKPSFTCSKATSQVHAMVRQKFCVRTNEDGIMS